MPNPQSLLSGEHTRHLSIQTPVATTPGCGIMRFVRYLPNFPCKVICRLLTLKNPERLHHAWAAACPSSTTTPVVVPSAGTARRERRRSVFRLSQNRPPSNPPLLHSGRSASGVKVFSQLPYFAKFANSVADSKVFRFPASASHMWIERLSDFLSPSQGQGRHGCSIGQGGALLCGELVIYQFRCDVTRRRDVHCEYIK